MGNIKYNNYNVQQYRYKKYTIIVVTSDIIDILFIPTIVEFLQTKIKTRKYIFKLQKRLYAYCELIAF